MNQPSRTRQQGAGLIEVLIAIVIISIGLLGMAKLQAASLNRLKNSQARSLAPQLAASLASMISANRAYWAASPPASVTVDGAALTPKTLSDNANVNCAATSCTPLQLAAWDLTEWGKSLAAALPGGKGALDCGTVNGAVACQIQVQWQEKLVSTQAATAGANAFNASGPQTFSVQVKP